jgi:hypothetical protein
MRKFTPINFKKVNIYTNLLRNRMTHNYRKTLGIVALWATNQNITTGQTCHYAKFA